MGGGATEEREASGFSRLLAARHSAGARRTKARGLSERASTAAAGKQITECAGHGGGFAGHRHRERVRGTHIIECDETLQRWMVCRVGLGVSLRRREHCSDYSSFLVDGGIVGTPSTWSMHAGSMERFPNYTLFSDFGSKIPEEAPCQIGCLVSCVLMLCLCRNYLFSRVSQRRKHRPNYKTRSSGISQTGELA